MFATVTCARMESSQRGSAAVKRRRRQEQPTYYVFRLPPDNMNYEHVFDVDFCAGGGRSLSTRATSISAVRNSRDGWRCIPPPPSFCLTLEFSFPQVPPAVSRMMHTFRQNQERRHCARWPRAPPPPPPCTVRYVAPERCRYTQSLYRRLA